jgi:hypothetical protein
MTILSRVGLHTLTAQEPPGETTHWTAGMIAKAVIVPQAVV